MGDLEYIRTSAFHTGYDHGWDEATRLYRANPELLAQPGLTTQEPSLRENADAGLQPTSAGTRGNNAPSRPDPAQGPNSSSGPADRGALKLLKPTGQRWPAPFKGRAA